MEILVNGKTVQTKAETIKALIQELEIEEKVMAVALNMEVVKKDNWAKTYIKSSDKVEFLEFVGGG